ncbi:MAG: hypothetical protein IJ766_00995 [Clostridia bacterium]|nr:hypothetical protein [Clostridia bacterium]
MTKKKRVLALMFAGVLLLVMLFSLFAVSAQWDHDCCGKGCVVCAQIFTLKTLMKDTFAALTVIMAVVAVYVLLTLLHSKQTTGIPITPVMQKVKLLS